MGPFVLSGDDNDLDFFRKRTDVRRCSACGALTQKWEETLDAVAASHATLDVSYSYDGVLVVSNRFRRLYEQKSMDGLRFVPVGTDQSAAFAIRVVQFDAVARKTRFEQRCASCGRFNAVAGATPAFLREREVVAPLEFVRTDLEFGSGDEQHPLVICGAEAAKQLREARLRGLDLKPVRNLV